MSAVMYLGIDLGTSSVKAILIDEAKNICAEVSTALTVQFPKPLWSEQDPEQWWQATQHLFAAIKMQAPKQYAAIKAIGLSGQQHGATVLDTAGAVLRPAILWNDGRSLEECHLLEQHVPDYATILGNRIMPGFTAPKLLWLKTYEPEIFRKIAKVLLPKDYLRYRLTGDYATDCADASGTCWLDVGQRCWSPPLLAATDLSEQHMPTLFEGCDITGVVSPLQTQALGLPPCVKVIAGGGDNAASAISMNAIHEGDAFLSLGTSGVLFIALEQFRPNVQGGLHTFCHVLPQRWHTMSVHLSAAASLSWFASLQGVAETHLLEELETTKLSPTELLFLPYLSGERTPHNDPYARGVFFGLSQTSTRAELTQAILSGVAFAFRDGLEAMCDAKIKLNSISVIGGGARSRYWGQILATVLQQPLIYRESRAVGGALGAARLAFYALNKPSLTEAFTAPAIETIIEPKSEWIAFYETQYAKYHALYPALKPYFSRPNTAD